MSSAALVEGPGYPQSGWSIYAAWETQGQVKFARFAPGTTKLSPPVAAPGAARNRKHPALAVNRAGEVLLAWTEGTGWNRGGSVAWQLYGADGQPLGAPGRIEGGVPAWGLVSVVASGDEFVILH